MPGPWSLTNPPARAGDYTNWRATQQPTIPPTLAGIVCIPFQHSWGPMNTAITANSWDEWTTQFGTDDTPGSRAVKLAFLGEGLPGFGGAGAVVSYRFGGTATPATAATVTLNKTGPTAQLKLTAKYPGTRANRLNVTVRTNAANPLAQDLVLYDGVAVLETYTYITAPVDNTPMADLAAQINLLSGYVTATVQSDGAPLLAVANGPLTGGTDGSTILAADWAITLAAVQGERFSVFVPYDNTDASIQASITAWIQGLNNSGKRVEGFSGGALGETSGTAITRAQAINDPNLVTLGVGGVVDYGVIGTPNAPVILSTSQAAPRIAGIFAARGAVHPINYARLPGWDFRVVTPTGVVSTVAPTDSDVVAAMAAGVTVLSRDSNVSSPLRVEKGVTTWQSNNNDPNRPYKIYSNPRYMKIMHNFESAVNDFVQDQVITPGLPMTQATREFVLGFAHNLLATMASGGLIQTGATVDFDSGVPVGPTDNFLALLYRWLFVREVYQVRNTVVVG